MYNKFAFFLFLSSWIFSQNITDNYNIGLNCFLNQDYICSRDNFSELLNNTNNYNNAIVEYSHYYLFLSALHLYNKDTEHLFDNFISKFPLSNKKNDAIFFMSEYLFQKKKYKKAINLLSQINIYQLNHQEKNSAFFYLGYSYYKMNKDDLAKNSFYELITSFDNPYKEDAIFYNSCILLGENNKILALSGFENLKESKKYAKDVPYFISKILFDLNRYENISNYLESVLDSNNCTNYNNLVLLYAKALYHLKKYDLAVVYFEEYKSLSDTLTREQLYQIGIAYYQKGLYGFAINHLNKIILEDDSIAQYAFYYLGDSYIHTNNRPEAMNAFRSASLLGQDSLIQHDSFYHFALLCYEQNNPLYNPIDYLSDFIEQYPNSEHADEVYTCLANIYLNSHNYDQAINVLEKSNFLDENIKHQYQKIAFYKAVQLYNDENYQQAIRYFDKSINVTGDNKLLYESYYWKAEAYYNLGMFHESLLSYQRLNKNTELYLQSLYAQGYCYLKTKDFNNSIKKFKSAIKHTTDKKILHDSYVRIGDNYFLLMNYTLSTQFYTKAVDIGGFQADYAAYKKSTAYVLLGDYNNAIKSFTSLIDTFSDSNYLDDAIFDLGNVYILAKNFNFAIEAFLKVIEKFPTSLFYAKSHLKIGLVYYMQEKDDEAILTFKKVLNQFPNSNVSQEALSIIKNIYNELGQANKFLELITDVNHDYRKSELDSSTYYSAELQYMKADYTNAINALQSYLSYYPKGLFYLEANYFLSKSYESIGDIENAMIALNQIVDDKENKYTVEAIASLARMSYRLKKYISSEMYFLELIDLASTIDLKQEAVLGVLESKFHLYKYNEVSNYILNLVQEDFFSGKDELRINYLKAYSLYKMNRNTESLSEFKWLINNTDGDLKAESFYYMALILYNLNKYDESQKIIFQLINELPNYHSWVNQSLLILAKNYIMKEDMFQAQHVLLGLEKNCNNPNILIQTRKILVTNFPTIKTDSIIENK